MTLRIHNDIEQGTDDWHELRRGIVTASVVGQLVTAKTIKPAANPESRALTLTLVAERITGWVEPTYRNADMLRGVVCEPIARQAYADRYERPVTECGFMVQATDDGWTLGYSPDGLVGDHGLIEVKCPQPKQHIATILANEVPAQYMAQCQAALLVSGRQWLDFVSFAGGLPLFVKRVTPDRTWNDAIVRAVAAFEVAAIEMTRAYAAATAGLPVTERVDYEMEII